MSNETCTVSIADIYGAEWWERNKEELNREWEWSFGKPKFNITVCDCTSRYISEFKWGGSNTKHYRIILHRRKPKKPTLREVYKTTEVSVPYGHEWTREWRPADFEERYITLDRGMGIGPTIDPRLILRERPKKVYYRAEEKERESKTGDWFYDGGAWHYNKSGCVIGVYLCATRHEEIDSTVQVVTQADIDKAVSNA
jgi:hypothetical protein